MVKQQTDKILQFFEKYSFDTLKPIHTQPQVEQYIQELGNNIVNCNENRAGSGYTIEINKRFFKKNYEPELENLSEIYATMIEKIRAHSIKNITIKSGRYELHIPNKNANYKSFIKTHNYKGYETKRYDTPYGAGKEFAELVGVNVLRKLNIPSIPDIINLFKN
ncbi:MAG: hypothetical protein K0B07_01195 [DPANN group archaeon]|nr:hypothetical protein [DPANN group archaeon]